MKKLFLLLAAVGMLATACEKESGLGDGNNQNSTEQPGGGDNGNGGDNNGGNNGGTGGGNGGGNGGDNGGNNGGGSTDVAPSIVGTWSGTFEEEGDKWTETYTFEANGNYTWKAFEQGEQVGIDNGTYTYEEPTLTLCYEGEAPCVYTVSISGNALTLTDDKDETTVYYRQ